LSYRRKLQSNINVIDSIRVNDKHPEKFAPVLLPSAPTFLNLFNGSWYCTNFICTEKGSAVLTSLI